MPTESPPQTETPARRKFRPDHRLLASVLGCGGEDLRKCMQCATCSSVCALFDPDSPGPRKEMLWAQWGLADRLMSDPNPWLCHQCGDCTVRCPRGARPADVMAAVRREHIVRYSWPRGFGSWANRPQNLLGILLVALGVMIGASVLWQRVGMASAELALAGKRAVFPYWPRLPHGLLIAVFGALIVFDAIVLIRGARHFWRNMVAADGNLVDHKRPLGPSVRVALSRILFHDDFAACSTSQARRTHHLLVVFGVLALCLTSLWAVTARWNPLLDGLVYPFGFWNPWKIMANLGGIALLMGSSRMAWERWRRPRTAGATRGPDVILLGLLVLIAQSGFISECLHWMRIEPLRYLVYAAHLALVFALVLLLPYSKLAHLAYRIVAMTYAEHTGRRGFERRQSEDEVKR